MMYRKHCEEDKAGRFFFFHSVMVKVYEKLYYGGGSGGRQGPQKLLGKCAYLLLFRLFLRPIIILAFDSKKVGIVGTF